MRSSEFRSSEFRSRSRFVGRGQALLEFALVILPVMLLLLGIVHGHFVFRAYTALGEAAEMGAETAAIFGRDGPEVTKAIEASLRGDMVDLDFDYRVTIIGADPSCAHVGDLMVIEVSYTEPLRFVFLDITPKPQRALRFAERDCEW